MKLPWKTMETNQKPWNYLEKPFKSSKNHENHETTLKNHVNQLKTMEKEVIIFRDTQTDRHCIIIYISSSSSTCTSSRTSCPRTSPTPWTEADTAEWSTRARRSFWYQVGTFFDITLLFSCCLFSTPWLPACNPVESQEEEFFLRSRCLPEVLSSTKLF